MSRTFASLKYPNYRLWFASTAINSTAVWMQRVAQDWVVLTELTANNATAIGIVTALQFAPQLLFSAYTGVLADRVNQQRLIQLAQVLMTVLSIFTAILLFSDSAQLWHFYLLAFAGGCVQTLDNPARQVFVNQLVPAKSVPNAVALNSAAFNLARLLGPAVAGFTLAAWGSWIVFAINAVLLLVPVLLLAVINPDTLMERTVQPKQRGQFIEGLRYISGRQDIIIITIVSSAVAGLGMNFQLTSAVMAHSEFGRGAGEFGLLGTFMAVGSVTGAIVAAGRTLPRVRTVVGAAIAFGVVEGVLALSPSYYAFAFISIPLGFATLTVITSANAAIQISTAPHLRGRVMSIYIMVFLGSTPIGAPLVGWITNHWGARWGIGFGAISVLLVSFGALIWIWRHWDIQVAWHRRVPFVEVIGPQDRPKPDTSSDAQ
ncbi:MFS transporter [Boudabousia marimammalium]|uniref:MFS transporter n=1 Tax=Boudabousia marimammalium TaxID=156892 RepID=A0A1Q5PL66_9ACTO|nr:MFS transporter [Boudabousia marimammalium]OKL47374.1 MFS transporter [Boudabousia marimammalium]